MAPKAKLAASTGDEGEGSEARSFASVEDVSNLRETVNQVTASIQDQLEKFQLQFETQGQQALALRTTLDQILRHLEPPGTTSVPWSSTQGSAPVQDPNQPRSGLPQDPPRNPTQDSPGSFPTGLRNQPLQKASRASLGLQQIASRVGKYKPEQPRKFSLDPGQEATALQIVTLKGQWKAFGMKQNWNEMEILATILTEGLTGKYYEWANNQEQFESTQFSSLHDFFQRLAKFHLAEEPITKTLVDIQRAWQRPDESPQEFATRLDGYQAVLKHFGQESGAQLHDDKKQLQFLTGLQRYISQQLHTAFMGKALEMDRTTLSILTEMPFARIVQAAQAIWQQQQQNKLRATISREKPPSYSMPPVTKPQSAHATTQDEEIENFTKRQLSFRQRFLHKILTPDQIKQARELNLCLCRIKKAVVCLSSDHIARDCPLRKVMAGDNSPSAEHTGHHQSHFIANDISEDRDEEDSQEDMDPESCYFLDMDLSDHILEQIFSDEEDASENDHALSQ